MEICDCQNQDCLEGPVEDPLPENLSAEAAMLKAKDVGFRMLKVVFSLVLKDKHRVVHYGH